MPRRPLHGHPSSEDRYFQLLAWWQWRLYRSSQDDDLMWEVKLLPLNGLLERPNKERLTKPPSRQLGCAHCSFAYSALACFRMGISGSASFQRVRKSL